MNAIEVEGNFPRGLTKIPVAVLIAGKDHQRYLDVYFPGPPVTFRLTHGNGPVYILAQSILGKTHRYRIFSMSPKKIIL